MTWVVRDFEEKVETLLSGYLDSTTLADLAERKGSLDDSLSMMPGF